MAGQQPPHKGGDRGRAGSQQQMKMVGNQRPRVTEGCGTVNEGAHTFQEIVPVLIAPEYFPAFDAPHDYMVEGAGSVYARLSGHGNAISVCWKTIKFKSLGRPT
jgi:hypothetical protein